MKRVFVYMTGNAWRSPAGGEIARILARNGFTHFMTECDDAGNLKERTMKGNIRGISDLDGIDLSLLSLDPVKGEFYEILELGMGDSEWSRSSNRPRDLDPVLGVRPTLLYKGMTQDEIERRYEKESEYAVERTGTL